MPTDRSRPLVDRLLEGDKRALARAISLVEDDDPEGWEIVRAVYPRTGSASVVGFTGPPGAGKSTLIGALIRVQRALERQVADAGMSDAVIFAGMHADVRPYLSAFDVGALCSTSCSEAPSGRPASLRTAAVGNSSAPTSLRFRPVITASCT